MVGRKAHHGEVGVQQRLPHLPAYDVAELDREMRDVLTAILGQKIENA